MSESAFHEEECLQLLRALDRAVFASERDGWATASEVRREYDGSPNPQGPWARRLWKLKSLGLAETGGSTAQTLWGLTESGAQLIEQEDVS